MSTNTSYNMPTGIRGAKLWIRRRSQELLFETQALRAIAF